MRKRYVEFIDDFESLSACQDKLWAVIQDEWNKMDPAKIYSICEHKYRHGDEKSRFCSNGWKRYVAVTIHHLVAHASFRPPPRCPRSP